ncbi:MAG: hypothetical protein MAG431_01972 [Chloroflexi bacterium]|nr:hypothetical protein [Chloroflexota bacterium]
METKAGAQISRKAFFQSAIILLILMITAGILTRVIPAGSYDRVLQNGREVIAPESFRYVDAPHYPVWRWFTAPVEALGGPDGLTVIVVAVFVLMVGGSFAILDKIGILKAGIGKIVRLFGGKKYTLLLVVSFFFMSLGAFFGIFEEMIPLVPIMLALSYYLGWDALVGLGMSVLATNMGFSAAITNPFTVTAYCFGDGFSNMLYPTNPVLLIVLGLTVVSYPKWVRWTWPLWLVVMAITILFLGIGVAIGYGPF